MAYTHIGHDCQVADHVVIVNGAQFAGHVTIEHHALVSGLTGCTQFTRLGAYSFMAAGAFANKDIVPFAIAEGHWATPRAINRVGLKRAGFDAGRAAQHRQRAAVRARPRADDRGGHGAHRGRVPAEPADRALARFHPQLRARDRTRVSKLRTAVVGVGYLGRFHAQKHRALDNVELVAVCDRDARARPQRSRPRSARSASQDYRELVGKVDAVTIAATTAEHFALARFFLEHGVHVLVEKPMTRTSAEAAVLTKLAARAQAEAASRPRRALQSRARWRRARR